MSDPGIIAAFGAGLLSFLSPCVLPLIPAYLSFISGYGLADIRSGSARGRVMVRTLAFVAGFTIVFAVLGVLFAGGGALLGGGTPKLGLQAGGLSPSKIAMIVAGIVIVLLGINLVFDFLKVLALEARFHPDKAPRGIFGSVIFGMAFAAGWSPCIGPILASILLVAAREANIAKSFVLLGSYSLGLALPFIAVGLFFDRMKPILDFFKRRANEVRIVSGLLLVALGLSMIFGKLAFVSSAAVQTGFSLKAALVTDPGRPRLIAALIWSILALSVVEIPLLRKKNLVHPVRIAFIAVFVALAILELSGLISTPTLVSEWLLFQGA
ncbi:MAG TPA: cytochrome c biogenesis protein CcdA [Rectinemataceae bacterium]|nr:cytochrome c biogenesis protein CcdA [Rectinemataceae bacterium]